MNTRLLIILLAATAFVGGPSGTAQAHSPFDPPVAKASVDEATRLARNDLASSLFFCEANPSAKVGAMLKSGLNDWFEPTRLGDNLSYVGNHFVGVFILETDDGLILFDSGTSLDDAEKHIAPGLAKLGLDPKAIKYIVVTHGHWDHFGGALWFQEKYKTPVGLSAKDWDLIHTLSKDAPEIAGHPLPHRDQIITDGQVLKVGSTEVHLYVTPGHTPGTVSAIFTAKQNGKPHVVSLLGSTAFPSTIEPSDRTDGLSVYRKSIARFSKLSRDAGAEILLNTHLFAFGGIEKLDAARAAGNGESFLIGPDAITRFYGVLDHCMQASEARILAGKQGAKIQ
jgi:metallo-beta-lactamase class B